MLPPLPRSAARSAAKKKATTGPFSKLEKSQEEQVKAWLVWGMGSRQKNPWRVGQATAAAATSGLQPWSDAMKGAAKVRDAYSQRSHELAQAVVVALDMALQPTSTILNPHQGHQPANS